VRVVLDTNVLVSALLNPEGAPGAVLDLVLVGVLVPVFDQRLVDECREVLARPRFGFAPEAVETLIGERAPRRWAGDRGRGPRRDGPPARRDGPRRYGARPGSASARWSSGLAGIAGLARS
jgi:hypothetical protein